MASAKSKLGCAAGCGLTVSLWSDHGAVSDRPRIVNDVSAVFRKFLSDFGWSFCVAGAVFGDIGGWHFLPRTLSVTFHRWRGSSVRVILPGMRSIWRGWRVTFVAPRIVNDEDLSWKAFWVAGTIFDDSGSDFCCCAHCNWRFICNEDQSWVLLCSKE